MTCDMKNCRLWVDGECTDEEEREKCPLMEARMDCRAVDDLLSKAYRVIGELIEDGFKEVFK